MKNDPGPESVYTIYSCAANPNAQTHPVSLPSWLLACFFYIQTDCQWLSVKDPVSGPEAQYWYL